MPPEAQWSGPLWHCNDSISVSIVEIDMCLLSEHHPPIPDLWQMRGARLKDMEVMHACFRLIEEYISKAMPYDVSALQHALQWTTASR